MICSPPDIALILGIALLVFGPKRLPELGHAIGQGLGNFKRSMTDAETSVRTGISAITATPVSSNAAQISPQPPLSAPPASPAPDSSSEATPATAVL